MIGFFLLDKSTHRFIFYISSIPFLFFIFEKYFIDIVKGNLLSKMILVYMTYVLLSLLWSDIDVDSRLDKALKGIIFGGFFCLCLTWYLHKYQSSSNQALYKPCLFFIFGCIVSIIISLYFNYEYGTRLELLFRGQNANTSGFLIGLSIIFLWFIRHKIKDHSKIRMALFYFSLFILALALMLTESRSAILALCFLCGVYFFIRFNKRLYFIYLMGFIFLSLCIFVSFMDIDGDFLRRGLNLRGDVWFDALSKIKERFFFGHGAGTEVKLYIAKTSEITTSTHNIILGVLLDTGFIGCAFFISILMLSFYKSFYMLMARDGLAFSLLFYGMVVGMFEFQTFFVNLNPEWLIWWMPIALIISKDLKLESKT